MTDKQTRHIQTAIALATAVADCLRQWILFFSAVCISPPRQHGAGARPQTRPSWAKSIPITDSWLALAEAPQARRAAEQARQAAK